MNQDVKTSALPERILYLCTCVAWAAKGNLEHLATAVPQALDHGVTINELKDALAQLYAYAGFPRSLNALGVLEKILNECTKDRCTMYKVFLIIKASFGTFFCIVTLRLVLPVSPPPDREKSVKRLRRTAEGPVDIRKSKCAARVRRANIELLRADMTETRKNV